MDVFESIKQAVRLDNIIAVISLIETLKPGFDTSIVTGTSNETYISILKLLDSVRSVDMMRLLIEKIGFFRIYSACVCMEGMSLLTFMIKKNEYINKEIIEEILSNGDSIDGLDGRQRTPLIEALICEKSYKLIKDLVIYFGACVNKCNNFNRSPLHFAYNKRIVKFLLTNGAEVNVQDSTGRTPLLRALELKRSTSVIKELLRYGADIHVRDDNGNTVYHLAHYSDIIKILFQGNPSFINCKNKLGQTPLMLAVVEKKRKLLVRELLYYDADPNCFDHNLNSPLHFATDESIRNILLTYGANPVAKNKSEEIPLACMIDCAFSKGISMIHSMIKHTLLISNTKCFIDNLINVFCDDLFTEFIKNCREELEKMHHNNISDKISLYKFCTGIKGQRKFFNIDKFLFTYSKIKEDFPYFYEVIVMKLQINKYRRETHFKWFKKLEKIVINSENKYTPLSKDEFSNYTQSRNICQLSDCVKLDNDCLYYVANYLTRRELVNLYYASIISTENI